MKSFNSLIAIRSIAKLETFIGNDGANLLTEECVSTRRESLIIRSYKIKYSIAPRTRVSSSLITFKYTGVVPPPRRGPVNRLQSNSLYSLHEARAPYNVRIASNGTIFLSRDHFRHALYLCFPIGRHSDCPVYFHGHSQRSNPFPAIMHLVPVQLAHRRQSPRRNEKKETKR